MTAAFLRLFEREGIAVPANLIPLTDVANWSGPRDRA